MQLIEERLRSSTAYDEKGVAQFASAIEGVRPQAGPTRHTAEGPVSPQMLLMEMATPTAPRLPPSRRDADRPGSPGIAPTVKILEWQADYRAAERELAGLNHATASQRNAAELTLLGVQGTVEQDAYSAASALIDDVVPERRAAGLTRLARLADDRSIPVSARAFWLAGLEKALDTSSIRDGTHSARTPLSSAYDQRAVALLQERSATSSAHRSATAVIADEQTTEARTSVYIWAAQLELDKKIVPALAQRAARLRDLTPDSPVTLLAQTEADLAAARQEADSGQIWKHWARLEVFAADPVYHDSLRSTQSKIASVLRVSASSIGMPDVGRSLQVAGLDREKANRRASLLEAAWEHAVGANTALAQLTVKQTEINQRQLDCIRLERNPPKPPASSGDLDVDDQHLNEFEEALEHYEGALVEVRGELEIRTAERNKMVALYRAERALVDQRMAEANDQEAMPGTAARAAELRARTRSAQADFVLASAEEEDARVEAEITRFQIGQIHDYLHGSQVEAQVRRERQTLLSQIGGPSPTSLTLRPVLDLLDHEALRKVYQFSPKWEELLGRRAASRDHVLNAQKTKIEINLDLSTKRRDRLGELVQQAERDSTRTGGSNLKSLKEELKAVQNEVLDLASDRDYADFLTGLPVSQRITAADMDRAKAAYVFNDKARLQRGFDRVADGLAALPRNARGQIEATIGNELDWYLATAMGYIEGLSLADSGTLSGALGREFDSIPSATLNSAPMLDEQAAYAVTQARANIRQAGLKDGARLEFDLVPAVLAGERQGGVRHFMFLKFKGADGQTQHIGPDGSIYKDIAEFLQDKGAGRGEDERFYAPPDLTLKRDEHGKVNYVETAAYVPSEQEKVETTGDVVAAVVGTVGGVLAAIPVTSPFGWIIVGGTMAYGGYRIVKGSYLEYHHGRSLNPFENPTIAGYAVSLSAMGLGVGAGGTRLAAGWLGRLFSPSAARVAGALQTTSQALGVSSAIVGGYDTTAQTVAAFNPGLNDSQRSEAILYAVLGLLDIGAGIAAPTVAEKIAKPRPKGVGRKGSAALGEQTIRPGPLETTLPILPLAKHGITQPENRQWRPPPTAAKERPFADAAMSPGKVVPVDPSTEVLAALGTETWRIENPLREVAKDGPGKPRDVRNANSLDQQRGRDDAAGGWRAQLETELLNGVMTGRRYRSLLDSTIGVLEKMGDRNKVDPLDYLAERWGETGWKYLVEAYGAETAVRLTSACMPFEDAVLPLIVDEVPVKLGSLTRAEQHERHTETHDRAVRYVINQATLWARAIWAPNHVSRAVVTDTAAFLIEQLRMMDLGMSQSLILRDADHYLTQYTQEWQTTKLKKPRELPPSQLLSHGSGLANWVYDRRKRAQFLKELAGKSVSNGIEESVMPASAPGGRGWAALGARHFRAEADTMRDVPERLAILIEMPAAPKQSLGDDVCASKPDKVFRFSPNAETWRWETASAENPAMAIRRRRSRDVLLAFDGTMKSWNSPYASNTIDIATRYQGDVGYYNGIGTTGVMPNFGALTGRGWLARARSAEQYLAPYLAMGPVSLDIVGFSRGAANARALANMLARWIREGKAEGLHLRSLMLMDTVAGNHLGQGIRSRMLRVPDEVEFTWHAVALHEGRTVFPVESIERHQHHPNADPKRTERAFIGGHGDVGGGEPGDLANVALHWITLNAAAKGVPIEITALEINRPISYNSPTRVTQFFDRGSREVRYPGDPSWHVKVQQADRIYGVGQDDADAWIVRVPGGKNTDVRMVADIPAYISGLERRGDYFPANTQRWRDRALGSVSIEPPAERIYLRGRTETVRPVRLSPQGERILASDSFPAMRDRSKIETNPRE
ncbi:DUF2235 domain-containing protein [Ensifer sp. ENS02]|uniref:phospholipase effector Tle1 domain-containing protein n=1 Tax=Ensifer sp. ENS02 TaxID=2769290 RepID=UPI001781809A|nr:DUF2235 domain-containing protein [Ensifer sp. ENS02]MBD9524225.1 DUF2235 domain-containing protein [Ensifer sp. ENS02]